MWALQEPGADTESPSLKKGLWSTGIHWIVVENVVPAIVKDSFLGQECIRGRIAILIEIILSINIYLAPTMYLSQF